MTAHDLLAELRCRGAVAYRVGDKLRVRPADAVPPELVDRLRQHKAELLPLVPENPPERDPAFADVDAFLVASRVLGEDVWLAADEGTAERLERELAAEGDHRLVFTVAEVLALEGMLAADMQTLVNIKRRLPGSRIDHVMQRERSADA